MLKRILYSLLAIVTAFGVSGYAFYETSDQFGAELSDSQMASYQSSPNWDGELFFNAVHTRNTANLGNIIDILGEFINTPVVTEPDKPVEVLKVSKAELLANQHETQLLWFGHSTALLQINGLNLLLDPMLSSTPAPHPMLGSDRYSNELPIEIADLPYADAVFISHDHYDHLDLPSIQELDAKVGHYYAPLGVGLHLQKWGISSDRITEMDWWQRASLQGVEFTFTPARHFSGRKLGTRNRTLWGGWAFKSPQHKILFTGDTGYGPHFKEIGDRLGEFDLAMVECGQYNQRWADIHLLPEQTIQAGMEAKAKYIMPIHWGAFTLAMHEWDDPVERAVAEGERLNQPVVAPMIGELVRINQPPKLSYWWRKF